MKVLLIDVNCKNSSTGKIVYDLYNGIRDHGDEAAICYGRGAVVEGENIYKFGLDFETKIHAGLARVTGLNGYFSPLSTRRLLRFIKEYQPDVVHIHELHAYFVNIKPLIQYLKENKIKTVWTFHCEYMYTGKCGHANACLRWQTVCGHCPEIHNYPKSLFFDFTKKMFLDKKKLLSDFDFSIVTPSQWLADRVKQSFLKDKPTSVIHNGIDTGMFELPAPEYIEQVKKQYGIAGTKIAVSIAPGIMSERKGGQWVLKLAALNPDWTFVLVGSDEGGVTKKENCIIVPRISNQKKLTAFYAMADAFVLCSAKETFSLTCAEALACGTRVVEFKYGAPETVFDSSVAHFVDYGDVEALNKALNDESNIVNFRKYAEQQLSVKQMVACLYQGVFYPRAEEEKEALREKYKLKNRKVILAVAPNIMDERKGGTWVLKLAERCKDKTFVLVGCDNDEVRDNCIFIKRTTNQDELAVWYSLADLFVICSARENFPTTCIEAFCCGTPVIGFDNGGTKETVPAPYGLFCKESVEELKKLMDAQLEKKFDRLEMARIARELYSKDKMVSNYIRGGVCRASIAMAVCNGERYLNEQIDSILKLITDEDEIVISYDKSSDKTLDIITAYAKRDSRIKVVNDPGKGVESNFNNAVKNCSGRYIFLADQDDVWINDKINKMIRICDSNPNIGVVISDGTICNENLEDITTLYSEYKTSVSPVRNYIKGTYLGCQMMFTSKIKEYIWPVPDNTVPKIAHDLWLGVLGAKYGKVIMIDDICIKHRIHENNYTHTSKNSFVGVLRNRIIFLRKMMQRVRLNKEMSNEWDECMYSKEELYKAYHQIYGEKK